MIDLFGKRFGKLTVILKTDKRTNDRHIMWFVVCDCGNYRTISSHDLIKGHTKSCGCNRKGINLAEKNGVWKGDTVGHGGLHAWIKNRKPKPEFCENCYLTEPYDLANISGEYIRDPDDYEWLCRKCHMEKDGRTAKLKPTESFKRFMAAFASKRERDSFGRFQCK